MKEGFYRIQHDGIIQLAYFINDEMDKSVELDHLSGIWKLTEGFDIFHGEEVKILEGPLIFPATHIMNTNPV